MTDGIIFSSLHSVIYPLAKEQSFAISKINWGILMGSTVLAYAFLRATHSHGVKNPIDSLEPLVKRALMGIKKKDIDQNLVQQRILNTFGIEIPLNVIRYTFPRLADKNILQLSTKYRYQLVDINYTDEEVLKIESECREQYRRLTSTVRKTINKQKKRNLSADDIIEEWLDTSSISFLGGSNPAYGANNTDREINRIIALTIKDPKYGPDFIEDLIEVALGDALYRAIKAITEHDSKNKSGELVSNETLKAFNSKMESVSVFFDTRIVLRALGFVNDELQKGADELLNLCKALNAKICVFDHTVEEIRGIITTVAQRMQSSTNITGNIASYAYDNGLSSGDLIALSLELDSMIEDKSFSIIAPPPLIEELSVEEKELDEKIRVELRQESELARIADIKSLTAVYRLRKGNPNQYLEKSDAIFITSNKGLADLSVKFFRNHFNSLNLKNRVQHCMTDVVFSTRLWTKLPTSFNELPRNQIISHALGNLSPDMRLKEDFKKQLKKLVSDGKLSDESAMGIELSRFTDQLLALEYEAGTIKVPTGEAITIVNQVLSKQRQLWDQIKNQQIEDQELTEAELRKLEEKLNEVSLGASEKQAEVISAMDEINRKNIDIEAFRNKEEKIRKKISALVHYVTLFFGAICLLYLFNLVLGSFGGIAGIISNIGTESFNGKIEKTESVINTIVVILTTGLTLGGLSLVGLQKKIEGWLTVKFINFFFD